jgi:xanthine dehydrogenase accessory factor
MGLTDSERARVRPHAGLDIGARTPKEIALSILAEVVREIRLSTVPGYPQATDTIKPTSTIMSGGGSPREGGLRVAGDHAPSVPAVLTISAGPPRQAIDPVCGMTVFIDDDTPHAVVDGQDYWFCRVGCRDSFVAG